VGRDDECDVHLEHSTVSRRHALIVQRRDLWWIVDTGSANGTFINDDRVPPGVALRLRHADRVRMGAEVLIFCDPAELEDEDRTDPHPEVPDTLSRPLSPFQQQVVQRLCDPWLAGQSLDALPSNEDIAASLGTPGASSAVKAALRRTYAKAGLTDGPPQAKRRALCRVARQRGWI
jgi:pSer/pThr/pTyr-binding forkhead associated (FHA) protein